MIKIQISEELLVEVFKALYKLTALEQSGVDNWDWYDDSLQNYEEEIRNILDDDNVTLWDIGLEDILKIEETRIQLVED